MIGLLPSLSDVSLSRFLNDTPNRSLCPYESGVLKQAHSLRLMRSHRRRACARLWKLARQIHRHYQRDDDQPIGAQIKEIPLKRLIGQIFHIGNLSSLVRIRRVDAMMQMYRNGSRVMIFVFRKLMMVRKSSNRMITNRRSWMRASTG